MHEPSDRAMCSVCECIGKRVYVCVCSHCGTRSLNGGTVGVYDDLLSVCVELLDHAKQKERMREKERER